jgi:hypothetical protein
VTLFHPEEMMCCNFSNALRGRIFGASPVVARALCFVALRFFRLRFCFGGVLGAPSSSLSLVL